MAEDNPQSTEGSSEGEADNKKSQADPIPERLKLELIAIEEGEEI